MRDSRRYHRRHGPRLERHFNFSNSSSDPQVVSPFGRMPNRIAERAAGQFTNPLTQGFGYNPSPGFERGLATNPSPLANFIRQSRANMANYIPQAQQLSSQITAGANQAYGGYQAAVDQFMAQLPGFQEQAGAATGAARTALEDAMSPLPGRATYQEAARRALAPAREGAAARGMLEGGQAQVGEQNMLSDLAFNVLQNEQANRQAAIQGLTGATGFGAQLAAAGPEMQNQLFQAYPQLAQLLSGAQQLPMEAQNQILQFLTAAQDPTFSLLRMVLPSVANQQSSFGMGVLSG